MAKLNLIQKVNKFRAKARKAENNFELRLGKYVWKMAKVPRLNAKGQPMFYNQTIYKDGRPVKVTSDDGKVVNKTVRKARKRKVVSLAEFEQNFTILSVHDALNAVQAGKLFKSIKKSYGLSDDKVKAFLSKLTKLDSKQKADLVKFLLNTPENDKNNDDDNDKSEVD